MRYGRKLMLGAALGLLVIGAGLVVYVFLPIHFKVTVRNTAAIPLEEVIVIAGRHRESTRNLQPGQQVVLDFRAQHEGLLQVQGRALAEEGVSGYCGEYLHGFVLEVDYAVEWYGERGIQLDCRETRRVSKFHPGDQARTGK